MSIEVPTDLENEFNLFLSYIQSNPGEPLVLDDEYNGFQIFKSCEECEELVNDVVNSFEMSDELIDFINAYKKDNECTSRTSFTRFEEKLNYLLISLGRDELELYHYDHLEFCECDFEE